MRLSARVEYAAIAALEIAAHGKTQGPVSLKTICQDQSVPSRFLVHILLQLKRAGIVKSSRGVGGGYLLARPAEEITLNDIFVAIEGATECPAAVSAGMAPRSRVAAVLAKAWESACRARAERLASFTLADLVARSRQTSEPMYYI